MAEAATCPECSRKVLVKPDGSCPSCAVDLGDEQAIKLAQDRREWEEHIYWGRRQGVKMDVLISELESKGASSLELGQFIECRMETVKAKRFAIKVSFMLPGLAMIVIGLISLVTVFGPLAERMVIGVFTYGIALVGVLSVGLSWVQLRKVV